MRIAVISDIHGNFEAFNAVLDDMANQAVDRVISLGDNIGYGADSEAVIQQMIRLNISSVLGNHELACVNKRVYKWYIGDVKKSLDHTLSELSDSSIQYLEKMTINMTWDDAFFVHGFWPDSVRHYLHQMQDDDILRAFEQMKEPICFLGHTHRVKLLFHDKGAVKAGVLDSGKTRLTGKRKYLVNAGSVGQPRDSDLRARYLIWDQTENTLMVRYVAYDNRAAARRILDKGLPIKYARVLYPEISEG